VGLKAGSGVFRLAKTEAWRSTSALPARWTLTNG